MFYALNWLIVVALLVLWSLAAWALPAFAVWTVSNAGALSGTASGVTVHARHRAAVAVKDRRAARLGEPS